MPLLPLSVLEAGSGTEFQLLPLFNIVGPFLGLIRNLGARHFSCKSKLVWGKMCYKSFVELKLENAAYESYNVPSIPMGRTPLESLVMVKK